MNTYLRLLVPLFFLACGNEQDDDFVVQQQTTLAVYENAQLSQTFPYVEAGTDRVFHFHYQSEDDEAIADDEFSEEFYVQINADGTSFDFSYDMLASFILPHLYAQSCFCAPITGTSLTDFSFEGEKKNDDWVMNSSITLRIDYDHGHFEKTLDLSGKYLSTPIPKVLD